jgi:hypothetical protein
MSGLFNTHHSCGITTLPVTHTTRKCGQKAQEKPMSAPAPDFYMLIHKAIRLAMSEYLVQLGATDAADPCEWREAAGGWKQIKSLLDAHSLHEDTHIHPLIHRVAPGIAEMLDGQHAELDEQVRALDGTIDTIADEPDGNFRRQAAAQVYRRYAAFLATYFNHLMEEETKAMPALIAHVPVEELFAAHMRLVGSIPPEEKLAELPLIARSLSSPERIALMTATQGGAPASFFAEVCRIMEEAIGPAAFAPVSAAISRKVA